ncbi:allergenic cerato-platanin Asp F13 [Aspergillus ruber CBS 135680]|uniref:Cerato-platanin-domain-containing protein n=1 Tax=Aspergillus ruber (strain CBS 135680) TaxID=1388766 RepID=A0A017SM70_ASPRC|nr:Cerato-platanin-domain-containing protein [Aspergillus ruber CBS 135680]EYE97739.1 Cerato-platanin-domain-containing protein [Aspergillus ruber CBS 135680]
MFSSLLTILSLSSTALAMPFASPQAAASQTISVSYDERYDQGTSSLTTVSCSDGTNGLITQGYSDFESLPNFPLIGGAPTVEGWNSPNCGKCYQLHYQNGKVDKTINVLAVDSAVGSFNLGLQALDQLTGGNAQQLGRVDATYTEVEASQCGV